MTDPTCFALHRPELDDSLLRGEQKLRTLLNGSARPVAAGQTLIRAGERHDYVYRLVSGWACRTRLIADGRDQFILVFLPGDLLAVKSLFVKWHTDDVKVLSDSVVQRIDFTTLHKAYATDEDLANRCMWQVVEEERRLHSWVFSLGQGSAEERLAFLLLELRGRLMLSKIIERNVLAYEMPLTQVQLADHLGITSVHVNRVLRLFREAGIVDVRDGEVVILNLRELTRRAYPLLDVYERSTPEYVAPEFRGLEE